MSFQFLQFFFSKGKWEEEVEEVEEEDFPDTSAIGVELWHHVFVSDKKCDLIFRRVLCDVKEEMKRRRIIVHVPITLNLSIMICKLRSHIFSDFLLS